MIKALAAATTVLLLTASAHAEGAPTPIAVKVAGDDAKLDARLERAIDDALAVRSGYLIDPPHASEALLIYVIRDSHSHANPKGVTLAITHISHLLQSYLAYKLLVQTPTTDADLKDAVTKLAQEGSIMAVDAAHLDNASDARIKAAAGAIAKTFLDATPSWSGPSPAPN